MRYRALDPNGDYTFGVQGSNFLVNTPQAVAQAVMTRLKLFTNEWFLDYDEGTPWNTQILGRNTMPLFDQAIQERILETPGVTSLVSYQSQVDTTTRTAYIAIQIATLYGQTSLSMVL